MTNSSVKFATRSNESSRRTWMLTSLAVRMAHALSLHHERHGGNYTSPYPPFEREMRRRLWWQICILDRQASTDRGSDPIIATSSFSTQLPLHVNDEDLVPHNADEVKSREEYTDTTLSLVCHEVFDVKRRLNEVPAGELDGLQDDPDDPWAQRRHWVIACQRRIEDRYLRLCDITIPVQRYTKLIADIMVAIMWLCTYRPLQRHGKSAASVKVPYPGILHLSVEVMEKAIQVSMDPSLVQFRWISTTWVQWHALAIMIAELCVETEGPTVERAWTIVDDVFEETARHIADSDKGRLWRPIKKLMNRAQAVRKKHLEDVVAASRPLLAKGALEPGNHEVDIPDHQQSDSYVMEVEPTLMGGAIGLVQQSQQSEPSTEPVPVNWDWWTATGPSNEAAESNELDRMAWTNWETFIDDFQADGEF